MLHHMNSHRSANNQLPVELLEHIFTYLCLQDRKNIRLTCQTFYDVCNVQKFLDKEEFVLKGNADVYLATLVLAKSHRKSLNVQLVTDAKSIPAHFWEEIGHRIQSLRIVRRRTFGTHHSISVKDYAGYSLAYGRDLIEPGTHINEPTTMSILFHCINSRYIMIFKNISFHGIWSEGDEFIFTYVYELVSVPNESTVNKLRIRALEKCSCTSVNANEVYASTYNQDGHIEVEAIYAAIEPETIYLLDRIFRLQESICVYTKGMKYLGVRISFDSARLEFLRRIARSYSDLEALVVRFDSKKSETESSNPIRRMVEDQGSYECSFLAQLQHLTVYGGCRGMLRISENFNLPSSLKHMDIHASDVQSAVEKDDGSDILSVLEYVSTNLPNLEILRVDNTSEWIDRRSTLTHSTSSFLISNQDEDLYQSDVCVKHACCKLSSVRHRFRGQNYTLTENKYVSGWNE